MIPESKVGRYVGARKNAAKTQQNPQKNGLKQRSLPHAYRIFPRPNICANLAEIQQEANSGSSAPDKFGIDDARVERVRGDAASAELASAVQLPGHEDVGELGPPVGPPALVVLGRVVEVGEVQPPLGDLVRQRRGRHHAPSSAASDDGCGCYGCGWVWMVWV